METDIILLCEDSVEGIASGIYEAYALAHATHRSHSAIRLQTDEEDRCLFAEYRRVEPDAGKCAKVLGTLKRRFAKEDYRSLCFALSAAAPDRAQALYRTVVWGLSEKGGRPFAHLADPHVRRAMELARASGNEWDHLRGFLRFEESDAGVLCAQAAPKNNVIPLLAPHFADRLSGENFVIRDAGRELYVIHPAFGEWFLATKDRVGREEEQGKENGKKNGRAGAFWDGDDKKSGDERYYRELFSLFCHTISIESRENLTLQRELLPLRFREYMTEFKWDKTG